MMNVYKVASVLGKLLQQNQLKIVSAESCTGGLISAAITDVPGSSDWFTQGWVTYSNESKIKELGVAQELIIKYGAVSEQVVIAMAEGALHQSGVDIAIATSGVAGPSGGSDLKPVGMVWLGIAVKNKRSFAECLSLSGNRKEIREQAVVIAMQKVIELI